VRWLSNSCYFLCVIVLKKWLPDLEQKYWLCAFNNTYIFIHSKKCIQWGLHLVAKIAFSSLNFSAMPLQRLLGWTRPLIPRSDFLFLVKCKLHSRAPAIIITPRALPAGVWSHFPQGARLLSFSFHSNPPRRNSNARRFFPSSLFPSLRRRRRIKNS